MLVDGCLGSKKRSAGEIRMHPANIRIEELAKVKGRGVEGRQGAFRQSELGRVAEPKQRSRDLDMGMQPPLPSGRTRRVRRHGPGLRGEARLR